MTILTGTALFLLAVVALAFVPGKLVLRWLKASVSPLEDVTLSLVLGLIVSGCVYWAVAFLGGERLYFLWPVLVSAAFAFVNRHSLRAFFSSRSRRAAAHAGEARRSAWQRQHVALTAVLVLGVGTLAVLPQYYSNLATRTDGTLRINHLNDPVFHLAIANELTHSVPPQVPFC